jgi:hypothetical protein
MPHFSRFPLRWGLSGWRNNVEKTKRITLMLSDEHENYLRRLGSGSVTEGVRVMIMLAQEGMLPPKPRLQNAFVVQAPSQLVAKPRGSVTRTELVRDVNQRVMSQQIERLQAAHSPIGSVADVDPDELARVFAIGDPPPKADPLDGWSE